MSVALDGHLEGSGVITTPTCGSLLGGTPGTTWSGKTPLRASEEVGFSTDMPAGLLSGQLSAPSTYSGTFAPDHRRTTGRPRRTDIPVQEREADPHAASQIHPQSAALSWGDNLIYYLSRNRKFSLGSCTRKFLLSFDSARAERVVAQGKLPTNCSGETSDSVRYAEAWRR